MMRPTHQIRSSCRFFAFLSHPSFVQLLNSFWDRMQAPHFSTQTCAFCKSYIYMYLQPYPLHGAVGESITRCVSHCQFHPNKERRILRHTTSLKMFEKSSPRCRPLSNGLFINLMQKPRSAKAVHRRLARPRKDNAKFAAMTSRSPPRPSSFAFLKGSPSYLRRIRPSNSSSSSP